MSSHKKSLFVISTLLLLVTVPTISYIHFNASKPKIIKEDSEEVKSARTEYGLPFPTGYKELSTDYTTTGRITTIEVEKTPKEVQDFYKNVLTENGWEIETQGEGPSVMGTEYKKKKAKLVVTTTQQNQSTIVSISTENN